MRTKINCDAVNTLSNELNKINDSIIEETKESINVLNEIKNIWNDYNSEKILNEMVTVISTLNNVSKDINTMSNFCTKAVNSYNSLDSDFKEKLVRDGKSE